MTSIRPGTLIRLPQAVSSALPWRAGAVDRVGRIPRWTLLSAGLAPVLLTAAWLAADARQPRHYSPMRQTVSVMSGYAGADRWLMTGGLLLVGACYFVTAAGLRDLPALAGVLVVTGAAAVGVAAFPQPAHGSTPAHMLWTGIGELALAALPVIVTLHRLDRPLLGAPASGLVAVAFSGLFVWLVFELYDGQHLGLAERLSSSLQTCWPFVVVLALRRSADTADTGQRGSSTTAQLDRGRAQSSRA